MGDDARRHGPALKHDDVGGHPAGHGHAHRTSQDGHGHAHGPGQDHAPQSFGTAFAIGIGLNIAFVALEAAFGLIGNSVVLLADAGHNLSDVLSLAVAWGASVLSQRAPTSRFTYGLKGSSILAALFNAVVLLIAVGAIALEAVQRLIHPEPVAPETIIWVAALGIIVNGVTAWLFMAGRHDDLNIRGAYLHMAADTGVSAGVVVAGLVILATGWRWVDPAVSLGVVAVIVWSTWSLLTQSVAMSLAAVPSRIDPGAVRTFLESQPGVAGIHDLHIWPMSTTEVALTAHLVMPQGHPGDGFLEGLAHELEHRFGIPHATIQLELGDADRCRLQGCQENNA